MAAMISSFSGGVVLTSRSVSGSFTSASIVGDGLLRTWLKCSAHPAFGSASVVRSLPRLSTIGVSVAPRYLPLTSFCVTSQVFHVGSLVCPCYPLHCLVCFLVLLPGSLFQSL